MLMNFRFNGILHIVVAVFLTLTIIFRGIRESQAAPVFLTLRLHSFMYPTLRRHTLRFIDYIFPVKPSSWRRFRGAMWAPCSTLHPMTAPRPGMIPHIGFSSIPYAIRHNFP